MTERTTLIPPPLPPRTAEIATDSERPRAGLSLVIEPAAGVPSRVPLPEAGAITIGGAWAELQEERVAIADPAVSARHARIEIREGRARIVDLGSRNGTWVGGARVEAAALAVGTCAIVGRSAVALEENAVEEVTHAGEIPGAIGKSRAWKKLCAAVHAYASLSAPVLIHGESGSGKEVVARALHQLSPRRSGPFQAVNLGALPRELAEGELFGHERGAFTGAAGSRPGYFELADGGTLLLDELGELPIEMQAKLLRVLETGEVRRLGARASRKVDVRVVAATWAPLERRIEEGTFREDLFHRIAVLMIDVPALRDRKSDIPEIARALLQNSPDFSDKSLSLAAESRLLAEAWPGNVRELRNVITRAAAMTEDRIIDASEIGRALSGRSSQPPPRTTRDPRSAMALVKAHGSIAAAARVAGVPRETMRDWVRAAQPRAAPR
ncbi:MAG: sigma 54-interacting transcriptional regulator [Polyangiales bacterium]